MCYYQDMRLKVKANYNSLEGEDSGSDKQDIPWNPNSRPVSCQLC